MPDRYTSRTQQRFARDMGERSSSCSESQSEKPRKLDEERSSFERRPWQYEGYPGFTNWIASSRNFALARRFNRLNAWVHLDWQYEIVRLEDELEELNKDCQRKEGFEARSDSVCDEIDPSPRRREIIKQLRPLLKEYSMARPRSRAGEVID